MVANLAPGIPKITGQSLMPQPYDTGAMSNGLDSPHDETITVTQGGETETVTIGGDQPGETAVITVGGSMQTLTVGSGPPKMTCEY